MPEEADTATRGPGRAVVYVIDGSGADHTGRGNPIIYPPDRPEAERTVDAVKEAVSKTMSNLGDDRPSSVTVRGFIGQPADALIEASHDADMVVVGERGGFARLLTRSVSAQVTHHAACPVVVISGQR